MTYEIEIDEQREGSLLLIQALQSNTETCERVSPGVYHVTGDYAKIIAITELSYCAVQPLEAVA